MNNSAYDAAKGCIVTYKPQYETMLFNELHGKCKAIKLGGRGKLAAAFATDCYVDILEIIKSEGLIFLQHIHPYLFEWDIVGTMADLDKLIEKITGLYPYIENNDILVSQCRIDTKQPFEYSNTDLTELIASELEKKGYQVNPQRANISISLTIFEKKAYLGISNLVDNVSEWTGGVLFYSKSDDVMCRAEFKIEEAFKVFDIDIKKDSLVLDLGAAPGGWTHFLSERDIYVDAVDPAILDEQVLKNQRVKHYQMTAQEFQKRNPNKQYDMIVNDMKMDTNTSIDILCEMRHQLKTDGCCLLTLKLPKDGIQKRITVAKTVLGRYFNEIRIRQLYYNRSEVTVYMKN